jgi:hypothetical protein
MGGLLLDVWIEFLIRVIVRFFKARGAASWPVIEAEVTGASFRRGHTACGVADITFKYRSGAELYTGTDANPFLTTNSAKEYLEEHPVGSKLLVRVRPNSPDFSIVRQDDLYRYAHGHRLATK